MIRHIFNHNNKYLYLYSNLTRSFSNNIIEYKNQSFSSNINSNSYFKQCFSTNKNKIIESTSLDSKLGEVNNTEINSRLSRKYIDVSSLNELDDEFIDLGDEYDEDDRKNSTDEVDDEEDDDIETDVIKKRSTRAPKMTAEELISSLDQSLYKVNPSVKDIRGTPVVDPINVESKKLKSIIKTTADIISTLNKPQPLDPSRWTRQDQKDFLEYIFDQMNYFELEDFYRLTVNNIRNHHGEGLLRQNQHSAALSIINNYPEYKWDIRKFTKTQHDFWSHKGHQKLLLDMILELAGLDPSNPYNWYLVTDLHIKSFPPFMLTLKNLYGYDIVAYLNDIYNSSINSNNNSSSNSIKFELSKLHLSITNNLASVKLKFKERLHSLLLDSRFSLYEFDPKAEISQPLMKMFKLMSKAKTHNSFVYREIIKTLTDVIELKPWLFNNFDTWYHSEQYLQEYFKWFSTEFGINTPDDWYALPPTVIEPRLFNSDACIPSIIIELFPRDPQDPIQWDITKFQNLPIKSSKVKREIQSKIIKEFGSSIGIFTNDHDNNSNNENEIIDKWYNLTIDQLNQFYSLHPEYHSFEKILRVAYPNHQWDRSKFKFLHTSNNKI